jgi:predicted RNase H-related nuclease YkuK (DUF458 family)
MRIFFVLFAVVKRKIGKLGNKFTQGREKLYSLRLRAKIFAEAKVSNLHASTFFTDQNIRWFKVSVHQSLGVDVDKALQNLAKDQNVGIN